MSEPAPPTPSAPGAPFDPRTITRPAPALMRYYTIISFFALVAFPVVLLVQWFKYETLRYRFDDEGISMGWGVLFKRETQLTYRRIQDIHVTRGIIQRWMGLATVSIQTASGSSSPEMQIEGIHEYDQLRDFLYSKMRGAKGQHGGAADGAGAAGPAPGHGDDRDEALELLGQIRDEVARLASSRAGAGEGRS